MVGRNCWETFLTLVSDLSCSSSFVWEIHLLGIYLLGKPLLGEIIVGTPLLGRELLMNWCIRCHRNWINCEWRMAGW